MSACVCMYVRESVCYRGVIVVTADEVLAFCDHASCQPWTWGLGAQGWLYLLPYAPGTLAFVGAWPQNNCKNDS